MQGWLRFLGFTEAPDPREASSQGGCAGCLHDVTRNIACTISGFGMSFCRAGKRSAWHLHCLLPENKNTARAYAISRVQGSF